MKAADKNQWQDERIKSYEPLTFDLGIIKFIRPVDILNHKELVQSNQIY